MSADLKIHVLSGATEADVRWFFAHTLGSPWFSLRMPEAPPDVWQRIEHTPQVWIGEVSWLKAAVYENGEHEFVPDTIGAISVLVGWEFPVITEEMIAKVQDAFALANDTGYNLADVGEVVAFLTEHLGERVFHVSW